MNAIIRNNSYPKLETTTTFKERWIRENLYKLQLEYGDSLDVSDALSYLNETFDKNFKDVKCIIYNNYERFQIDTTIYKTINWINKVRPILTESGSMFKQHSQCWNPDTIILGNKLDERKVAKSTMFKYDKMAEDCDNTGNREDYVKYSSLAAKFGLKQRRIKIIVNSEYGTSGLRSSWFFNMACASATTARGRALISTAENAFEDFLADNVRFTNMDECVTFISNILSSKDTRVHNDAEWVSDKHVDDVLNRLKGKFLTNDISDDELILKILKDLPQEDLNRIYYKSNLTEFFKNSKKASRILRRIVNTKVQYLDPMKPPSEFKDELTELRNAVLEYVHYCFPTMDRVYRLRNHKRKRVIVIDTDSNFINMEPWVHFVEDELFDNYSHIYRRKNINGRQIISSSKYNLSVEHDIEQHRRFRIIHAMVFIISEMIANTLDHFMERCNLEDMSRNTAFMKNEILYDSLLITNAMKHYQGAVRIKEGNLYKTPKLDVKGMEYRKPSMASANTRQYIESLVFNDILLARDGKPNVAEIIEKLRKFEKTIKNSMLRGDYTYFKTANIKTGDAYDSPFSIGPYKAAYAWNYLYPDKEIELPGVAYIVKVKINKLKDVAHLATTFPDIYERFENLFNLEIQMIDRKTKETKTRKFGDGGIKNIAVPLDCPVPEWLKSLIDTTEIIENNTRLVLSILDAMGIRTVYNSKGSQFFSNIIEL